MTDTLSTEQLEAVKARQQATWDSGNYAVIGTRLQIVGELLCEAVDLSAGQKVLDVAAGNGNASLADVAVSRRQFHSRFRSADDYFETFKTFYGPTVKAWGALDPAGQQSLRDQLVALADSYNRDTNGALTVPADYLEVVATRR